MIYDPSRPLVSLHIPKTGGTSLRSVLMGWFGPELHQHYLSLSSGGVPPRHHLGPGACVHGHFNAMRGFGSADYYPGCDQFITFLREPFARCVSIWRYRRRPDGHGKPGVATDEPDFQTWLFRKIDLHDQRGDSFLVQLPGYPDQETIEQTLRTRFVSVGLTEGYESSVRRLAHAIGKPVPEHLEVLNVTEGREGDFSSYRKLYEREFPEDYDIYELGRSLHAVSA